MRLYTTDDSYVVAGMPRPGIPFLCDRRYELVEAPNRFLDHIAVVRGRTRSMRTWRTYGQHLYDLFSFLEENELDWARADDRVMAAWRDGMLARGNVASTVNARLRCAQRFYEWAVNAGLMFKSPVNRMSISASRPIDFLGHTRVDGGRADVSEITLREPRKLPKYLAIDQAIQFLDALTPQRLRLMGYVMLLTGMRREEVAGLDYRVIPNPAGQPTNRALDMVLDPRLTPTKGLKQRTVKVPYQLGVLLYEYFTWERPKLEKAYRLRNRNPTTKLFLTQAGDEVSVDAVSVVFNTASVASGVKCTPHMLRHTFGTYEFMRMNRVHGQDKALFWVRDRLGHSSIVTTEIYVHMGDMLRNEIVDGYMEDVCEALVHGS